MTLMNKPALQEAMNDVFHSWWHVFISTNNFIWQLYNSFWWKVL